MGPSGDVPVPPDAGRTPQTCGACGGELLTQLSMVLADGTDVTFISCHECEVREWLAAQEDGTWETLPIASVLERSARKPR